MREISKEEFKKSIIENVKNQYRRTIDEATPQQIFQAVSYAIKDVIIDDWIATQKQFDETGAKKVYYLSMEFLMGRALGNNIINLGAKKAVKEALEELGFDLNAIEDQEPDPALGNGGLGRLAACFLDSLATLGYPAYRSSFAARSMRPRLNLAVMSRPSGTVSATILYRKVISLFWQFRMICRLSATATT